MLHTHARGAGPAAALAGPERRGARQRHALACLAAVRPGHALEHGGPEGQLRLATQALQLQLLWQSGRWRSDGSTRLEALAVSSRLSPLRPLGSYRLDILGGDSPQLQLSTLTGDLRLSGQGQWVGQRLHFQGEASASPERETALSNLLNILGRRQGPRSIISFG